MAPPAPATRGPSAWSALSRSPPPRPPRLAPLHLDPEPPRLAPPPPVTTSSVSSPSAPDPDCAEVDELLEGIDRVRIDDLWQTPRPAPRLISAHKPAPAPFRPGLFAPPERAGAAPLPSAAACAPPPAHSRPYPPIPRSVPAPLADACHHNAPRSRPANRAYHGSENIDTSNSQNAYHDFPRLFKVYACRDRATCLARGTAAECFGYHGMDTDRRRVNTAAYKPHMCRFIEEAGGCRKGDRCPFSHNDFERRYHPDRFGKETCRDFLRGDCPRRYCTFRHEVSGKVEVALAQMDAMTDKEMLQLVLKIGEPRGRALCEKLMRRFGNSKKHSGWRLEGFKPNGRDDQKVKYVTARVEEVKRRLKTAGERKWASSLKTSSLRDMMSGVRKVAEEIRERCRGDENYVENGNEVHRLIRAIFSNTNWSCHSQEGDNPFLVTPENQNDAMSSLEKLMDIIIAQGLGGSEETSSSSSRELVSSAQTTCKSEVDEIYNGRAGGPVSEQGKGGSGCDLRAGGYAAMIGGEEFGVIGQKGPVGMKAEREVSTLWAVPAAVGRMAT